MKLSGERRAVGPCFAVAVALVSAAATAAQAVPLELVLSRAARYVGDFVGRFSNVVTEERYVQEVSGLARLRTKSDRYRELRSDFLLVKPSDSPQWLPFRDVFEVDGAPVRDREERLARLFLESSSAGLNRARQISNEGARYNLASNALFRTVNNPLLALVFLEKDVQERIRYQLGRHEPDFGPNIYIVEFREEARPTFVRGAFDRDLPAKGRFWIDVETGRIAQVELVLIDSVVNATLTTVFRYDDRLEIDAPAEMRERYRLSNGGELTGSATYGRFRRFDVSTEEKIDKPR